MHIYGITIAVCLTALCALVASMPADPYANVGLRPSRTGKKMSTSVKAAPVAAVKTVVGKPAASTSRKAVAKPSTPKKSPAAAKTAAPAKNPTPVKPVVPATKPVPVKPAASAKNPGPAKAAVLATKPAPVKPTVQSPKSVSVKPAAPAKKPSPAKSAAPAKSPAPVKAVVPAKNPSPAKSAKKPVPVKPVVPAKKPSPAKSAVPAAKLVQIKPAATAKKTSPAKAAAPAKKPAPVIPDTPAKKLAPTKPAAPKQVPKKSLATVTRAPGDLYAYVGLRTPRRKTAKKTAKPVLAVPAKQTGQGPSKQGPQKTTLDVKPAAPEKEAENEIENENENENEGEEGNGIEVIMERRLENVEEVSELINGAPLKGSEDAKPAYNYSDSKYTFRCFSCSSGWKNCSGETSLPNPEKANLVPCPQTHSCFVRQDMNGEYHRGCADGFFSDIKILGAKMDYMDGCMWGEQVAHYGSFVKAWCFCNTGGCNINSFADLGGNEMEPSPLG